jgi:tetratricopeptide (TPR) repeat protein
MMKNKALLLILAALPNIVLADSAVQSCQKALNAGDFSRAAEAGKQAEGYDGGMCRGKAQLANNDFGNAAASFAAAEKATQDNFQQMLAVTFLARAQQGANKIDDALASYDRSLKIAQQIKQQQGIMINLNESGQLLQSKGDIKGALERYLKAMPNAGNDNERSECDQLIAAAYSELGDHDKAIEYQLKSVLMEERSGDADHYLNARLELAAMAAKAKDFNRAQKEFDETMKLAQGASSDYWQARTMLYQSRMERARGNTEQAKLLLQNALGISNKIGAQALGNQIALELKQ